MSPGRQLATLEALQVVLQAARAAKLRALTWTLPDLGTSLHGTVKNLPEHVGGDWHAPLEAPEQTRAWQQATFDGYAAILDQLYQQSLQRFGQSSSPHLQTELKTWPPFRTSSGEVRLTVVAEHVKIPLGRNREVSLLSLAVSVELRADDTESGS